MNKLYFNESSLQLLESVHTGEYDCIILEPPFNILDKKFVFEKSTETVDKEYANLISHLIENASRILNDNGILYYIIPITMNRNYNHQMVLEHFFKNSPETIVLNNTNHMGTQSTVLIYCCSNKPDFSLKKLKEPVGPDNFPKVDSNGRRYRIRSAFKKNSINHQGFNFEWKNITPPESYVWTCSKKSLETKYQNGDVEIIDSKVFIKQYQDQTFRPISLIWNNEKDFSTFSSVSRKNIFRLMNIFDPIHRVLIPYDREGYYAYCLSKGDLLWVSNFLGDVSKRMKFVDQINKGSFIKDTLKAQGTSPKYHNIVKSATEIDAITKKMQTLQSEINKIRGTFKLNNDEDVAELCSRIQDYISKSVNEHDINDALPEAKDWITPNWDKLELKSQYFLPTGFYLYNQLIF